MTDRKGRSGTIDVKPLLGGDVANRVALAGTVHTSRGRGSVARSIKIDGSCFAADRGLGHRDRFGYWLRRTKAALTMRHRVSGSRS